jgi:hypothetical protein
MAVKYSYLEQDKHIATQIDEGEYAGVLYRVGRIQFSEPDNGGHRGMRFKYELIRVPEGVEIGDDFTGIVGDIIVEQIEEKLDKGEMIYANGKD